MHTCIQDYSTRKVLERTVKGLTHDKAAISVAPPKAYAKRFVDFVTHRVFMSESEYNEQRQIMQPPAVQQQFMQAVSLAGRRVSEASSVGDDGPSPSSLVPMAAPLYGSQQQQQREQHTASAAAAAKQFGPATTLAPIATTTASSEAPGGAEGPNSKVPAFSYGTPTGTAAAGAAAGGGGTPHTPLLSFADAHILAAGAHDMNLELLGSPDALSATTSLGACGGGTTSSSADGTGVSAGGGRVSAGSGAGVLHQHHHQQLQQLVSAEEVSVSVHMQASEGGEDSSHSNHILPSLPSSQQQQGKQGQMGAKGGGKAVIKPLGGAGGGTGGAGGVFECSEEGGSHSRGGNSSPAEAEVIVVADTTTSSGGAAAEVAAQPQGEQQQQPGPAAAAPAAAHHSHLGSQHANLLAKLGA